MNNQINKHSKKTITFEQLKKLVREPIFPICEGNEHGHEDFDWGCVIGTFTVEPSIVNEMGSIGQITHPHLYYVYIHPDEGLKPHFHIFNKEGMHRDTSSMKGFHTCVAIRCNKYFKHGAYTDDLDKKTMAALDKFMGAIRDETKSDAGMTNYLHTIREWNDNNAEEGTADWVDLNTEKPDYTRISGNL